MQVIRAIISRISRFSAADVFAGLQRLSQLQVGAPRARRAQQQRHWQWGCRASNSSSSSRNECCSDWAVRISWRSRCRRPLMGAAAGQLRERQLRVPCPAWPQPAARPKLSPATLPSAPAALRSVLQAAARVEWRKYDVLLVPTAAYNYTVQEIQAGVCFFLQAYV